MQVTLQARLGLKVQQPQKPRLRKNRLLVKGYCHVSNYTGLKKRSVAVIGAGPAGLATAKELLAEGHRVVIFEQAPGVGGVWKYTDEVERFDLLGKDPSRRKVHSSLYESLRTNLPRETMSFAHFPFDPRVMGGKSVDPRRYPVHREVQIYLEAYAYNYNLHHVVRFQHKVLRVEPPSHLLRFATQLYSSETAPTAFPHSLTNPTSWRILVADVSGENDDDVTHAHADFSPTPKSQNTCADNLSIPPKISSHPLDGQNAADFTRSNDSSSNNDMGTRNQGSPTQAEAVQDPMRGTQNYSTLNCLGSNVPPEKWHEFDAVVVCNGHYSDPYTPEVEGQDVFPGILMHAHNYRKAEQYRNKIVVLVGQGPSGLDIGLELAQVAKVVYVSHRAWGEADVRLPGLGGTVRRGALRRLRADGGVEFDAGEPVLKVDVVIFCTGYRYSYPFLPSHLLTPHPYQVAPLYQHVFPPAYGPSLSFIGLNWKSVPFPLFEIQAAWVAKALSGAVPLPPPATMFEQAKDEMQKFPRDSCVARFSHALGETQFEFNRQIGRQIGKGVKDPGYEIWREKLYTKSMQLRRVNPCGYRDGPSQLGEELEREVGEAMNRLVAAVVGKGSVEGLLFNSTR